MVQTAQRIGLCRVEAVVWIICSAHCDQKDVPRFRLTSYGESSFDCAATAVWNSLPDSLKDECYVQSSIEFRVLKLEFRALTE